MTDRTGTAGVSGIDVVVFDGSSIDRRMTAARSVRRTVFTDEQGIAAQIDNDGRDATALHAVASLGATVVGTGRVVLQESGSDVVGRVGRMAVLPQHRGAGVGAELLRRLEVAARRAGARSVVLHAQQSAAEFYRRLGYRDEGRPFEEAGIPHQGMTKGLPVLRPGRDADGPGLISVIGGCFAEYPGCVLDVDAEEPWLRAPASAYQLSGGQLWVIESERGGAVLGCAGLKPGGEVAELKSLYVAAPYRRLGLATDLVGEVEAAATGIGRHRIELFSDTRFREAHRLYERLGYRRKPATRDLHDLSKTTEYHYAKDLR